MPYFVTPVGPKGEVGNDQLNLPVSVGVIDQTVMAARDIRGEDHTLLIITNPTAGVFEGVTSSSPDGVNQWTPELNDEFASIPAGATRRMLLPADRLFVRVTGRFVSAPGSIYLSVIKLREAGKRSS